MERTHGRPPRALVDGPVVSRRLVALDPLEVDAPRRGTEDRLHEVLPQRRVDDWVPVAVAPLGRRPPVQGVVHVVLEVQRVRVDDDLGELANVVRRTSPGDVVECRDGRHQLHLLVSSTSVPVGLLIVNDRVPVVPHGNDAKGVATPTRRAVRRPIREDVEGVLVENGFTRGSHTRRRVRPHPGVDLGNWLGPSRNGNPRPHRDRTGMPRCPWLRSLDGATRGHEG